MPPTPAPADDAQRVALELIDLLHELAGWLREHGTTLAAAARRPWTDEGAGWADTARTLHEELLARYATLCAALARTPHDDPAWALAADAVRARVALNDVPVSWDLRVADVLPWLGPARRLQEHLDALGQPAGPAGTPGGPSHARPGQMIA